GADGVDDLRHRVERDAELTLHEFGRGILERLRTVVGIAAVLELLDFALERIAHQRMGHLVILADAEVEERALGMLGKGLPLGALDLLELVDFSPLAVVGPTNALGKEGLEPGVGGSSGRRRIGHGARPERLDGTKSLEMIIDIGAASASPVHPGASR